MGVLPRWRRSRRDLQAAVLTVAGLVAFVAVVYLVIVLGGGAVIGQTESPNVALSVLATGIVAIGFEPVRSRLDQLATRLTHDGRPSPYDVLSRFAETVYGGDAGEPVLVRMARVLAEGTGAEWAQVWLLANGELVLDATWPADVDGADRVPPRIDRGGEPLNRRVLTVRQAGEPLGVLRIQVSADSTLTPVEERLFAGLADQAGLVLQGARLRTELALQRDELAVRSDELRQSRERLVDTQDHERRQLERDIHDGAQQHLVALAVNLRLAQTVGARAPERASRLLSDQIGACDEAVDTLLGLSRGIYPRLLTENGVGPALRAVVASGVLPVEVRDEGIGRHSVEIESALYFCALEAVQNAGKHSSGTRVVVTLLRADGRLGLEVDDDGSGFDPVAESAGDGLENMRCRIDAAGGRLTVGSRPGGGTRVTASVPVPRDAGAR